MTATRGVAVVGARGVGVGHVAALRQLAGIQVSLIVGSTSETAQTAARSLGVPRWSADWQAAVDDEAISAIHVCTPNDLHLPIAAAALAAGKHVICEKPLARSAPEASHLARLARDHGHQLSVLGYKYRYAPLIQLLREHVQKGRLGHIHEIRASYLQNWMLDPERSTWRRDAGRGGRERVLLDIGTHLLDLMETTLGARLVSLHGQVFSAKPSVSEAAASADGAAAADDVPTYSCGSRTGPAGSPRCLRCPPPTPTGSASRSTAQGVRRNGGSARSKHSKSAMPATRPACDWTGKPATPRAADAGAG